MLPREHFIIGLLVLPWLSLIDITWPYIIIMIAANVLIDFDHYMCAVLRTGKYSLKNAINYYKHYAKVEKKINPGGRGDFHVFHTVEAHLLVLAMASIHSIFFAVFVGMVLHTVVDNISLMWAKKLHRREFLFFRWVMEHPRPDFSVVTPRK